ncbi:MAG: hypothetical protein ACTHU0_02975, partial [Kofleriaceae bacterium]
MPIAALPTGDVHDFDFLAGHWEVVNRRLATRFANAEDWHEFPSVQRCELWMGGVVNVDEAEFPTLGFSGMSLRVFDVAQRRWAIYWINSKSGVLFPPVHGGFTGDRGEFYGSDEDAGAPVDVRFTWTKLGPDRARWEQAFSRDGATWETNWVME